MTAITFDSLGYAKKLEAAGFTRAQAEAQAEIMREQTDAQNAAMQKALDRYDEASRKDLATKGDLADTKHEILKWVMGIALAQTAAIVAVIGVAVALVAK